MTQRLREIRGFAFDLDGTIWAGPRLLPGAAGLVESVRAAGLKVVFASNGSRHGPERIVEKLASLGIAADVSEVVTAFHLAGDEIRRQRGPLRVLVVGTDDLAASLAKAGHVPLPFERWSEAQAVVLGNDPAFDFARLQGAARVVNAGGPLFAVNLDARFPTGFEPGDFEPGCGAMAEAILVAADTGARPIVIGKPSPPLFNTAVERLGCQPAEAAMVGDSYFSDMAGGIAAGMFTVWLNPEPESSSNREETPPDLKFPSLDALHQAWQNARSQDARAAV
jgi:HAD superfamily hydrolase (TIGR01450 family)